MIQVRYFASLREQLGRDAEAIEPSTEASVAELRALLCARGEPWATALAPEQRILAAVNQEMARPDSRVADGDELAFFPPVTGG
ncbi:molybdopterin converting factor subunit 1 [Halochromatium roseum]|uniref:molybdopterin converting factor subunit 1 n=1 Tax=Halochromatium roseum TaxID=391920 RepID=UPI0019119D8E|nr:molybdopterin converting factor subunit 1 [Halochromatium roseum]MBK5939048.1 molybdopterin converting factor subunit 1 [Halochromatium roseum]